MKNLETIRLNDGDVNASAYADRYFTLLHADDANFVNDVVFVIEYDKTVMTNLTACAKANVQYWNAVSTRLGWDN